MCSYLQAPVLPLRPGPQDADVVPGRVMEGPVHLQLPVFVAGGHDGYQGYPLMVDGDAGVPLLVAAYGRGRTRNDYRFGLRL